MAQKKFDVYITEPCRINGEHFEFPAKLELEDSDAMNVVAAGRGSLAEPPGYAEAVKAKSKGSKADA